MSFSSPISTTSTFAIAGAGLVMSAPTTDTTTANNAQGVCVVSGVLPDVNTSEFTAGDILYVKTGGGLTNVRPDSGAGAVAVCAYADASNGVLVVTAKGNGTWGALKNGLS